MPNEYLIREEIDHILLKATSYGWSSRGHFTIQFKTGHEASELTRLVSDLLARLHTKRAKAQGRF